MNKELLTTIEKPKREVNEVYLHCSASDNPEHDNVATIKKWHKGRGFKDVGYHFFIQSGGTVEVGRSLEEPSSAQRGHNTNAIAICMHGNKVFTEEQRYSLRVLCHFLDRLYDKKITFHGHTEVNKHKTCPNYDYIKWLKLDSTGHIK